MGEYLQRSRYGTIFYFRRKLPIDLRFQVGLLQLYLSLRTANRPLALMLARRAATLCDDLFLTLRAMATKKPAADLMELVRTWQETFPLREEIWRLREEATEAEYQRNKAIKKLKDDHADPIVDVVRAAGAGIRPGKPVPPDSLRLGDAIKAFLARRDMKPRSRKRFSSLLEHFEKFMGADTWLHEITQSRIADYADAVNGVATWSLAEDLHHLRRYHASLAQGESHAG